MTREEYYVRSCTALLDAVGGTIQHIGNVHKYAREEDRPERTLFIITTDGKGTAVIYEAMSDAVCSIRACRPMSSAWKRKVDMDYRKRSR